MGPLTLLIASPMLGALALLFVPRRGARYAALASSLPPLAVALWLLSAYDGARGGFQFGEMVTLLPSLGIQYKLAVDGLGVPLVFLTAVIYATAVFTSWNLAQREREFFIWMALLVAGVFGVFTSLDLFLFFLFYELAVLPMYLLIGIWGSTKPIPGAGPFARSFGRLTVGSASYGAMKLTLYLLAGSAFILLGLFLLYVEGEKVLPAATFDYEQLLQAHLPQGVAATIFLLFYVGFGILAGIWPFHTWSPDGHAAAPAAGSMMHAGVLMKLGAYGVLRLGFALLPEAGARWAWLVGAVAAINIVYGAVAAGWQTDVKYLIAYSSVSHMGIVMLGMATLNEPGLAGSVFQMVSHGIMTAMLFTLVNLLYAKTHTRDLREMGGLAAATPGLAVFFVLGGLASLGLPGLSGFWAEFLVFLGAFTSAQAWWLLPAVAGAFVTALYVLRAAYRIFFGPMREGLHVEDAKGTEWVSLAALSALLVLLGVWPRLLLDAIRVGVDEVLLRVGG
ncbi:MAG TPA: NADH-quinone oxidoreductase subunit M [Candidatus Polarisedimenticolaceae bacterium]|nr:NADH-quinone oxidoreductase subunit M [Candidatus Polarisedimenticolaceae bacterium]